MRHERACDLFLEVALISAAMLVCDAYILIMFET